MVQSAQPPVERDLDRVLEWVGDDLRSIRKTRIFITGGTGFIGTWLLETLAWANARLDLDIRAVVLTRAPAVFAKSAPHLAENGRIAFITGDVRQMPADLGTFDGVIHAATPASADLNENAPDVMLDTIVTGGRAVLELAAQSGAIPLLFTSSGAVYGRQPQDLIHMPETYGGAPDVLDPRSAYHEGKRIGELQCTLANKVFGLEAKIARIYALVGPYLPLDIHFAMGNFIRDALDGKTICVRGDGTTVRSYLYAADMVAWLWAIYVRGVTLRPYNVGSEEAISTAELARRIAATASDPLSVEIMQQPDPTRSIDRYVPGTERARTELGLRQWTPLDESIRRTMDFYEKMSYSSM